MNDNNPLTPVELEIVRIAFVAAAEEMSVTVWRTPLVGGARDIGLLDRRVRRRR